MRFCHIFQYHITVIFTIIKTLQVSPGFAKSHFLEINIALNKPTGQTKTDGQSYSRLAVDGRVDILQPYACAITVTEGSTAKWWVNLQHNDTVFRLTIYNINSVHHAQFFENFSIYVGYSEDDERQLCAQQTVRAAVGSVVNYTCSTPLQGSFVIIKKYNGHFINALALCEVKVLTFYVDCSKCFSGPCSQSEGCTQCVAGKMPPTCTRAPVHCDYYTEYNMTTDIIGTNTATVSWKYDSGVNSAVQQHYGYYVRYRNSFENNYRLAADVKHSTTSDRLTATLTDLSPDTYYHYLIAPYRKSDAGDIEEGPGCHSGFKTKTSSCGNLSCQNKGACEIETTGAICVCTDGYTGSKCETEITLATTTEDSIISSQSSDGILVVEKNNKVLIGCVAIFVVLFVVAVITASYVAIRYKYNIKLCWSKEEKYQQPETRTNNDDESLYSDLQGEVSTVTE